MLVNGFIHIHLGSINSLMKSINSKFLAVHNYCLKPEVFQTGKRI